MLIGTAQTEIEANVWRDILDADGIRAFMKSSDPLASFGVTPVPGSIEVYVQKSDERRARWLLGERAEPEGA